MHAPESLFVRGVIGAGTSLVFGGLMYLTVDQINDRAAANYAANANCIEMIQDGAGTENCPDRTGNVATPTPINELEVDGDTFIVRLPRDVIVNQLRRQRNDSSPRNGGAELIALAATVVGFGVTGWHLRHVIEDR